MEKSPVPVWLGTAGYSWPDWVGPFYPPGTSASKMLTYYASQFPFVEINSTFYRPPSPGQMGKLAARTPAGFRFSLKVPRTASHERSVHDLAACRQAGKELTARDALVGFVLQFPESFHDTPRNRAWASRVGDGLRPYTTWVEFRHSSWARPRLGDWLKQRGMNLIAVDVPDLPQLFPRGVVDHRASRVYLRLHSRQAAKWTGHGTARYAYDFSDCELRQSLESLRPMAPQLTDVHIIFNNCHGGQAIVNARRIADMICAEAPAFRVIEPPPRTEPIQGTLFDEPAVY
jgi:uncharacterized protein YecE (DUF72 family)